MPRRSWLMLAVAISLLLPPAAGAQEYPNRPVTLIVPWPAGGSTDIAMRTIAASAEKVLGQPVVVENRPGGGGTIGPATMATIAKPDGYTIAQMPITMFRMPLMQDVSWNPSRDFSYIVHLVGYTFGVTTSAESRFKTWKDVVDFAKANPGQVTYATPGSGTSLHIGMEQIATLAGIKLTQVPFKGGAETNAAVLGQHTMLQADSTGWRPLVDAGKLRLLMVWTEARSPHFPDVPTLKELGYPMVYDSPFGIAGPKGMDPKIAAKLHDAFKKAIQDPAVIATLAKYDMVPNYKNTDDYRKFIGEMAVSEHRALHALGLTNKTPPVTPSVVAAVPAVAPQPAVSSPPVVSPVAAPVSPSPPDKASLGRRVALVLGNGSYKFMPSLRNPGNDAADIASTLKGLGFETIVATDMDRVAMNGAVSRFSRIVVGADVAVVYYSGHGMQYAGKNYLLPVDANLERAEDVNRFQLMPVDDLIDMLGAAKGLQLLVLDACRNNPVEREFKNRIASAPGGNRDVASTRGFTRIEARGGLLVTYATAANDVASDGDGRNSPFTKAFLKFVVTPDLEVRQMLYRVQKDVYNSTGSRQLPEISSLYVGPDISLK